MLKANVRPLGSPIYTLMKKPASPKRPATTAEGKAGWYNYYAGYSPEFVVDVIKELKLSEGAAVLDPWNGAGTTTQVADDLGLASFGYDINPVMVVIAKARLLRPWQVHPSEESLCQSVTASPASTLDLATADPLATWLDANTVAIVRGMEQSIRDLLVPNAKLPLLAEGAAFDFTGLSSLAAFFYVALFRVVRELLKPFLTSNPTWIKEPEEAQPRLSVARETLVALMAREVRSMSLANFGHVSGASQVPIEAAHAHIGVADSTKLPKGAGSVQGVISSPPYLTRIDYAVATWPELAVLGAPATKLRALRELMIGSAAIRSAVPEVAQLWGPTCCEFLQQVADHDSKGSLGYYWKTHRLYFDGIYRSLEEINRVLASRSDCVLVVQDSFYKEIHIDLPKIIEEMTGQFHWTMKARHDYSPRSVMATLHPGGRTYRKSTRAVESVLHFVTPSQ